MTKERKVSFIDNLMVLHENEGEHDRKSWYESLLWNTIAELKNIGFDQDAVSEWIDRPAIPPADVLQELIDAATKDDSAYEPLTVEAYKNCFHMLILLKQVTDDTDTSNVSDPTFNQPSKLELVSVGIELGVTAFLVGWEHDWELADSFSQARRGSGKLGVKSSIPNRAIQYAISKGYATGKAVETFFEDNQELGEIGLSVSPKFDRFQNKIGYLITDNKTGKSKPITLKSLSSMVSNLKMKMEVAAK